MPDPKVDDAGWRAELSLGAFRAAVTDAVVPLHVHTDEPDAFRGHLDGGSSGDIHVFGIRADQHAVHRTPALVGRGLDSCVKLAVIERGSAVAVQDGRDAAVSEGDMVAYDTDRPYSLLFDSHAELTVVMFPKALLTIPAELLAQMTAVRMSSADGVGGVVRPFLSSIGRSLGDVEEHMTRRLYRTAVDMVGTLLEANADRAPGTQELLVAQIREYIDDHLTDHGLGPTQIASAHYISVRHLHGLFHTRGTTVSTLIRTRRLERCYDELANPLNGSRPVSAIALDNGFRDAAHFSRSFRAHFGISPSSIRG